MPILGVRLDNIINCFEAIIDRVSGKYLSETLILHEIAKKHNLENFIPEIRKIFAEMD